MNAFSFFYRIQLAGAVRASFFVCALLLLTLDAPADNLPRMGEPVDQTLSPQEERRIGRQFMQQARVRLPLLEDEQAIEYLQGLGERLLAGMSGIAYPFTFFIVEDSNINAFAVPGGYIAVNTGLISNFQNESQLAAVMAHEIAHVTQRHHARAYSAQGKSGLTTAAAILAAILIGQQSPQAGQAALATGLAVSQQNSINYTRANEYEADRIGIDILARAGFSAEGMVESFNILTRHSGLNSSGLNIEYLRTHPLGDNRIAEAKARAASLRKGGEKDSLDFRLFKTRLAVITAQDQNLLRRQLEAKAYKNTTQARYGRALLQTRNQAYADAMTTLSPLIDTHADNFLLRMLNAELQYLTGDKAASIKAFDELIALYPTRYSPVKTLATLLVSSNETHRAYDYLVRYERRNTRSNPDVYRQLADVHTRLNDPTASHEYLATFYAQQGSNREAVRQLRLALKTAEPGSQAQLRIQARLRELNPDKAGKEQRRR